TAKRNSQEAGSLLLGLDFPIGLPSAYARNAGINTFREGLALFGTPGAWEQFFVVSDQPDPHRPFGPKSNVKGGLGKRDLAVLIGLRDDSELYRRCDQRTATRQRAESLFFTRFARQVGRSACE